MPRNSESADLDLQVLAENNETKFGSSVLTEGEGGGGDVAWDDISGKPAIIAAGGTQAAARSEIGAGTSSLNVGSTNGAALGTAAPGSATTAARSDHVHPMPTAAAVGAAATGHTHTFASLAGTVDGVTGADLQAILEDLATRVAAVEP